MDGRLENIPAVKYSVFVTGKGRINGKWTRRAMLEETRDILTEGRIILLQ